MGQTDDMPWPVLREDFAERRIRREDEVEDVRRLVLAHADPAAGPPEWAHAAATAVAVACLGEQHLWQDLLLPHRGELNRLLRHWFPAIVARNSGDMKWKKFFYRQLCEQAEVLICKSPSCGVCEDYARCFEPADEHSLPVAAAAPRPRAGSAGPAVAGP